MSNKDRNQVAARFASQMITVSGPLPPANEFEKYEHALPGAADRILKMAEKEIEHRHKEEEKLVNSSIKLGIRGQLIALVISILSIALVLISILFSQPLAAIAPSIIALTGLSTIFLTRNK
jgi:uncharacterized membrane protein